MEGGKKKLDPHGKKKKKKLVLLGWKKKKNYPHKEEGEKVHTWNLSYSEGRGEATLKRRVSFWSVTMTFPSKVQPAGGCFELQTLYGACRVFVQDKSQDKLVKIGCFTQNGDLSNTHTPTPAHIHKFKFGFLHFGAVVRFV